MNTHVFFQHQREAVIAWKPAQRIARLVLGCGCLCMIPLAVPAQEERSASKFYFGSSAGIAWQQEITAKEKVFGVTTREKVRFDPGARLDFSFGYQFTESFAAEFESGVSYNAVSSSGETSINSGNVNFVQVPLFANAVYRVPTRGRFKPFLGAGAGGMFTSVQSFDLLSEFEGDNDAVFAYQGFAGLRYQITKTMDLGLAYKYTATLDHTFDRLSATTSGNHSQSVLLSFLIRF
jgi:opacity protein-like surface antigen